MKGGVVLLGQAPSRTSDPARPFSGKSGEFLSHLLGWEIGESFELRNLLPRFPGRGGLKGDRFPLWKARLSAVALGRELAGRRVVFMGRNVARAFKVPRAPYLRWFKGPAPLGLSAVFPHPSGVNRWWNTRANRAAALLFLKAGACLKGCP